MCCTFGSGAGFTKTEEIAGHHPLSDINIEFGPDFCTCSSCPGALSIISATHPHPPPSPHTTPPLPQDCYPVPCLLCSSQAQWRLYRWRSREGVGRCGLSAGGGAITVILHHSVNCCPDRPLASGHLALTPAVAFVVKKEKGGSIPGCSKHRHVHTYTCMQTPTRTHMQAGITPPPPPPIIIYM